MMCDFTKEELQIMLLDMNVYINTTKILAESPSHKRLREKLEHMIDNYCEHDTHETSALIKYCCKCNHSEFISL